MTATPFDSAYLNKLFPTGDVGRLFSDSAEIRALMIVEGSLAKVQGARGVIPEISARAIHRASLELQIDPAGLAGATGQNGVAIPALVAAFRELMQAPEHAQYIHWGATSQDILDTGLMLRMRQVLAAYESALRDTLAALADLAEAHADLPMAARTYGQFATPTSFGAVVAGWGWPLLQALEQLEGLRAWALWVSLSGAAGTSSALGPEAAQLRADLAEALGLNDPGRSWHNDRSPIAALTDWMAGTALALGKMGEDLILATASETAELRLPGSGASSTMPQKQNPVAPSALVALARHANGLAATLKGAVLHRQARDGAAWFTEWLTLPQLALATAAALEHGRALARGVTPDAAAMASTLDRSGGAMMAEALSFALAAQMPRPEAQAAVKALAAKARETGAPLRDVALSAWPDLDPGLFDPARQLGQAPAEAAGFARAARAAL
ncbi:lyase family protein [Aestuariicoccus sp. MJ-SS9]|uniref:lyase family protein n=1 Tax=Aestuariicoccus sp. MJ-SS9 TaxID=3079855 RepID=UPI00290F374F|nr:lyase family protein [Aestuariicoccus sp. MJ-SS9]MDU8913882.1 lyase family protein [Aestuariicoccus sp. MJ-SS9]